MICCFKAVTLMEGTNVIWCGVDPKVHDSDRSALVVRRQQEEMRGNPLSLYLFTAINSNNPNRPKCHLGPSEVEALLMEIVYH